MPTLTLNFDMVHTEPENNDASQAQLDANRGGYAKSSWNVLKYLLNNPDGLTVRQAMQLDLSGDLRRRVKEFRDNGIEINDKPAGTGGGAKRYYMEPTEAERVKTALINGLQFKQDKAA